MSRARGSGGGQKVQRATPQDQPLESFSFLLKYMAVALHRRFIEGGGYSETRSNSTSSAASSKSTQHRSYVVGLADLRPSRRLLRRLLRMTKRGWLQQ